MGETVQFGKKAIVWATFEPSSYTSPPVNVLSLFESMNRVVVRMREKTKSKIKSIAPCPSHRHKSPSLKLAQGLKCSGCCGGVISSSLFGTITILRHVQEYGELARVSSRKHNSR